MQNFELDPSAPYFGSDANVQDLYARHAIIGDPRDDLLDRLGLYCDELLALEPVAMRGVFRDAVLNDHTFRWTFTPGDGDVCAIVLPVIRDGRMIDLVACGDHGHGWGCVTGHGEIAGLLATEGPLIVRKSAWRWLQRGCNGVLPLAKSILPQLASASLLIAEDLDHVDELAYRGFSLPACDRSHGEEGAIAAAELAASEKIGIDTEFYDLDQAMFQRAGVAAVQQLRIEGVLK